MGKLRESIISEQTGSEELAEKGIEELAKNVENPHDAAKLIKKMHKKIKIKKNNILMIAYEQGKIFNKLISAVNNFKISKTTINLKIGIVELIDKYPKLQKS